MELGAWPREKGLVDDQEPNDHSGLAPHTVYCVEKGKTSRRTSITAALHQSGLYDSVARRRPFLCESDMKSCSELAMKYLKDSQECEGEYSLV